MRLVFAAIAAAGLAAAATPAHAGIALEANAARANGQWGLEAGAGYSVLAIDGFRITPGVGVFVSDKSDDRFGLVDSGGAEQCREIATGQPADEDLCDGTGTRIYGRVEATYSIPLAGLTVGTGARIDGQAVRPYGTVSVPLLPMFHLKGNVGHKYYSAGLAARF
jgi:hypothetical protein